MENIALALSCIGFTTADHASQNDISDVLNITGNIHNADGECNVEFERSYMLPDTQDIKDLPIQGQFNTTTSGTINTVRLTDGNCKNNCGGSIAIRSTGDTDSAGGTSFMNISSGDASAKGISVEVYGYSKNIILPNTGQVLAFNEQYPSYVGMVKRQNTTPIAGY